MKDLVIETAKTGAGLVESFARQNADRIVEGATIMARCLASGGKILFFGNGGSAADAQHLAAELVNRFAMERKALAAIALTTDTSVLTSHANDYSFETVFARQIQALGKPNDIAFGISTSGQSANVIEAQKTAREMGLFVMALSGKDGGRQIKFADWSLVADSAQTPRIQEAQISAGHILCSLVEQILFPQSAANSAQAQD
ncbi:MAG: D-sedoheptulose 7-phosphate isomerase [Desulfatibacillaceae bacterium]|nr:D-sedoheptulose 7-phosphate isomerase [Desulfatibacillaceae bacterium]